MRDPLVLILADDRTPGGCVRGGAGMQEESLFRRTALFSHLTPDMYPILPDEALYARDVPVLLSSEASGYRPVEATASFVACPGVKMPRVDSDGRLSPADEAALRRKVRLILDVASAHGHSELVLGALGCGVWGCPARHVVQVFAEELSGELAGASGVRRVRFAILGALANLFSSACAPLGESPSPPGQLPAVHAREAAAVRSRLEARLPRRAARVAVGRPGRELCP